jgi:hypothetical protein
LVHDANRRELAASTGSPKIRAATPLRSGFYPQVVEFKDAFRDSATGHRKHPHEHWRLANRWGRGGTAIPGGLTTALDSFAKIYFQDKSKWKRKKREIAKLNLEPSPK